MTETDKVLETGLAFLKAVVRLAMEDVFDGTAVSLQPRCLSKADAAKYLAISPTTVGVLKRRGEIKAIPVEGRLKYLRKSLDDYLNRQETA